MEPREHDLTTEAVVVAHATASDGEPKQLVEQDRLPDEPAEVGIALIEDERLAKGGEIAAQPLEGVHPEGHALLDHERVERQVWGVSRFLDMLSLSERMGSCPKRGGSFHHSSRLRLFSL